MLCPCNAFYFIFFACGNYSAVFGKYASKPTVIGKNSENIENSKKIKIMYNFILRDKWC